MQTKNVSFFCESPIVLAGFMQQPTSDAHPNTYLISANFDGISYNCDYTQSHTKNYHNTKKPAK